jgi:hypothetical protein
MENRPDECEQDMIGDRIAYVSRKATAVGKRSYDVES